MFYTEDRYLVVDYLETQGSWEWARVIPVDYQHHWILFIQKAGNATLLHKCPSNLSSIWSWKLDGHCSCLPPLELAQIAEDINLIVG